VFHWNADAVCYRLGGRQTGTSSHDCDQWIAEVNLIAPLIGLPIHAARNLPTRVRQSDGRTKVQRVCAGTVSFDAVSRFRHAVRRELGVADAYYREERNAEPCVIGPLTMFDAANRGSQ